MTNQTESPAAAANEAIDRVERNAHREFLKQAYRRGCALARQRDEFTSVDLRDSMARLYPSVHTHDDRALGAVMRGLARDGVIAKTDRFEKSQHRRNHNRPLMVWQSRIRRGG
ncbi:MAG: hypothetical protein ACYSUI_21050 [Planctomycetota bacterium]|jgi:hypothetical protein